MTAATTHYQLGFRSGAGAAVRYTQQYGTVEAARTALIAAFDPARTFIFAVTVEEVK